MKYTARLVAVVLAMTLSLSVFAAGQFKDIQRAMMDSKWGQAEEMLLAYTAKDPNNGKGHFLLATVYEQTRRYSEAKVQLDKAFQVAPDKRWASPGQADAMSNRLAMKLAMNNPKPRTENTAREPVRERTTSYTPPPAHQPTPVTVVTPKPIQTPAPASSSGGHGVMTFLLIMLAIGVIGGGIWYFITTRDEKRKNAEIDDSRRALLATVVSMQERLQTIRDKLKYQNKLNSELGNMVDGLASSLNTASSVLRDRSQAQGSVLDRQRRNLDMLESQLSSAEGRLGRKDYDPEPVAPAPTQRPMDSVVTSTPYTPPRPIPAPPPRPVYQAPTPAPEPTVVHHHHHNTVTHDNSGPDILTTVLVADALSSRSREHERQLERENDRLREERRRDEQREQDRRDREIEAQNERFRRDEERARANEEQRRQEEEDNRRNSYSAPAMDFGGSDDNSSSSDSSSGMDFGGSDD